MDERMNGKTVFSTSKTSMRVCELSAARFRHQLQYFLLRKGALCLLNFARVLRMPPGLRVNSQGINHSTFHFQNCEPPARQKYIPVSEKTPWVIRNLSACLADRAERLRYIPQVVRGSRAIPECIWVVGRGRMFLLFLHEVLSTSLFHTSCSFESSCLRENI